MTTRNRWKSDGTNSNFEDAGGGFKRAKINNRSWFQNLTLQIKIVSILSCKYLYMSYRKQKKNFARATLNCDDQIVHVLFQQHNTHDLLGRW